MNWAFLALVTALAGAATVLGGCNEARFEEQAVNQVIRTTSGDTVVVRSVSDAEGARPNGAPVILVTRRGHAPESPFGFIDQLEAAPDGGVLLLDSRADGGPIIRRFGADGVFLNNIGRRGEGPGEYTARSTVRIAVSKDGVISVRDRRAMIHQFQLDGTFIGEFTYGTPGRGPIGAVYPAAGSSVYLESRYATGTSTVLFVRVDRSGTVIDEIVDADGNSMRSGPGATTFRGPQESRFPLYDGSVVHVRSENAGFLLMGLAGKAKPLRAVVELAPVAYLPEERDEFRAVGEWQARRFPPNVRQPTVDIPKYKFASQGFGFVDLDDRIWIKLSAVGQKIAPRMIRKVNADSVTVSYAEAPEYAVFRLDGEFLRVVRFPLNTRSITTVGNAAWAVMIGEDDVHELVKFRLGQLPGAGTASRAGGGP